ncbi:LysR family transcriptional regulator [Rhizobium sp. BK251]|uniref:LysR family transcriptional regulator n=1 Tax=Rhizobium sp. BK251 TaxID=2512125 RepID=UPI00104A2C3F|nr:LysR family transcriptional regulator [Rhizobium sp. BK251]TCL62945.1 LysR family transcriptional regulator [Rhizobium sp. BK251]
MDRIDVMRLFVRVVESESFSKAARAEGVVQPTVSKQIAGLEARLGAQLLRRTSRGLSVTDAGEAYYNAAIRLLGEFDAAESNLVARQAAPSGRIRVALSAGFGRMYVMPHLPMFFERYPDITVETDITDKHINLVENHIDVAIRIGKQGDSSLISRRIGSGETVLVAFRNYLEKHPGPTSPADLRDHACVTFVSGGTARTWEFRDSSGPIIFEPSGPVRTSDAEHVRAGVLSDIGIAQGPAWLFRDELKSGAVQRLLTDFAPPPHPINAVSPGGRLQPSKVKLFIEFLAQTFATNTDLRIR